MKLSFDLEYHGWLDITIAEKENHFLIPASFLSDVIYDSMQRISSLIEGAIETIIVIQTEPGEYRIQIKHDGTICTLEIFEFEDNFCSDELNDGSSVFITQVGLKELARVFWIEIDKLRQLGENEYKYRWSYDFPVDAFKRLERAWKSLTH